MSVQPTQGGQFSSVQFINDFVSSLGVSLRNGSRDDDEDERDINVPGVVETTDAPPCDEEAPVHDSSAEFEVWREGVASPRKIQKVKQANVDGDHTESSSTDSEVFV